jgi:V/A-type H+-transporting ATPase subunit E
MSLATIIQKIDAEAEASRQKILTQANAEAERIREQARTDAEREASDIRQQADHDLQSFTQKQLASAQLQARNRKMENRQEVLRDVYERALERILACEETQFEAVMKAILLTVTEERAGKIIPAKSDRSFFSKAFLEGINTELKTQKRSLRYTRSSKTATIPRGCIIDFQDFEMNYSLANILADLWEQMKPEVSAQLFSDGNH